MFYFHCKVCAENAGPVGLASDEDDQRLRLELEQMQGSVQDGIDL